MGESRASVCLFLSVEAGFPLSLSGDRWLEQPDPVFADEGMGKQAVQLFPVLRRLRKHEEGP